LETYALALEKTALEKTALEKTAYETLDTFAENFSYRFARSLDDNVAIVALESLYLTSSATQEHVRRFPVVIVLARRALDVQSGAWSALWSSLVHDFV
jgi:hypothetical protein